MSDWIVYLLAAVAAYLLGSIPFGFLVGKMRGVDIRTVGSHNIGATNVYRTVGKKWGVLAFACDFLKGLLPVLAVRFLVVPALGGGAAYAHLPLLVGIMTVVGHMWTCYLGFKGGKGVATGFGMLIGLTPALVGVAFFVFVVVLLVSHYVSLGSISAAAFLMVAVWPAEYFCAPHFHHNVPDLPLAVL